MSWSEVTVPVVRDGVRVPAQVRFADADPCLVEVWLGAERLAAGEAPDLFDALIEARRALEHQGLLLAVNGSRRDVYPSAMQRQAAHGRRAYVLTLPRTRTKPPVVDIFDPAPEDAAVVTVVDQRAAFDKWLPPRPVSP